MRTFDTNWEDWKPGDLIVWDAKPDKPPLTIIEIDAYDRVFWVVDGKECGTRCTNMLRITESEAQS